MLLCILLGNAVGPSHVWSKLLLHLFATCHSQQVLVLQTKLDKADTQSAI